jgi:CubicO group peptidase (beta-lactamase class C family)
MTHLRLLIVLLAVSCLLSVNSPLKAQTKQDVNPQVEQRIRNIENGLADFMLGPQEDSAEPPKKVTLSERMAALKVPGVSMAVINDNKIEWAKGYGVIKAGVDTPVTVDSLFEAASTTKLLTTVIVLRLLEQGRLSLEEDVNRQLKSWKIPENTFTQQRKVTLRLLLTHKSGLNRPEGGIGYEDGSVPTLVQVLRGQAPAQNPPAVVTSVPGSKWQYSNFDFLVIQLLLEEVLRKPFAQIAHEVVLEPLGMTSSTLVHPLKAEWKRRAAAPHDDEGKGHERAMHPTALAQGGLLTTPSDLARFTVELMRAYQGQPDRILSQESMRLMLAQEAALDPALFAGMISGQGLGVFTLGDKENIKFLHPGFNIPGATCMLIASPVSGKGAVVMTNGAKGELLMLELTLAIQKEYDWPTPE